MGKELKIKTESVESLPERRFNKSSIYDATLETFNKSAPTNIISVEIEGKSTAYIYAALTKRIKIRKLPIEVRTVNNKVYLQHAIDEKKATQEVIKQKIK